MGFLCLSFYKLQKQFEFSFFHSHPFNCGAISSILLVSTAFGLTESSAVPVWNPEYDYFNT